MRTEFNNIIQALKMFEDKITELEKRMECAVNCVKEIQDVTNKFEGTNGVEINLKPSDLEIIQRASNDIELALDLNDKICVEDNWYGLFE